MGGWYRYVTCAEYKGLTLCNTCSFDGFGGICHEQFLFKSFRLGSLRAAPV
jgi:hypothetical protein